MIERINPAELARPSGFSHAVIADGMRMVALAGQTAVDIDGHIVGDGIVAQFRQALSNVLVALNAAGGSPADLVSMTIYLTDLVDYQNNGRQIGAVWTELVGSNYPAMAGLEVSRLWDPAALVELQAWAALEVTMAS
ncbi:MAG TPA: RidA family protein [Jatrophihabitans sp.]|jgi:enamine deaminase RidA (YjgF/YER057c/UK114 family)